VKGKRQAAEIIDETVSDGVEKYNYNDRKTAVLFEPEPAEQLAQII